MHPSNLPAVLQALSYHDDLHNLLNSPGELEPPQLQTLYQAIRKLFPNCEETFRTLAPISLKKPSV